jgi:lipopolysaccharide transport system permease protein
LPPTAPGLGKRLWYPLAALTRRELRKRYASTWLGTVWAVLQPLATVAIYLVVFGVVLRYGRAETDALNFALFMLAGLLPFQALAEGLQRACGALREDRLLLQREGFPAEVVPLARVLSAALPELVGLALLVLAALATGHGFSPWLALLPLLVLLRLVITAGLALALSVLSVFVADVTEVLSFALTALLFLTPVFYAADQVPAALQWSLAVNPLHQLVDAYRALLFGGSPPLVQLVWLLAWALLLGAGGIWLFRHGIEPAKDLL